MLCYFEGFPRVWDSDGYDKKIIKKNDRIHSSYDKSKLPVSLKHRNMGPCSKTKKSKSLR